MFKSKKKSVGVVTAKKVNRTEASTYIYVYGVYSNDISCTLTPEVRAADIDFTGPRE